MMATKPHEQHCGCAHVITERNRYYTGKFMTARDFADEQKYLLSRHALINRLMHGWGIVCGLGVSHHPNQQCAKRWVKVGAGIALDCCGRELFLPKDTAFELPLPPQPQNQPAEAEGPGSLPHKPEEFLLLLRLHEEEIEFTPALYNEGVSDPAQANRIREMAVLEVRRPEELDANCWGTLNGDINLRCRDDCDQEVPAPAGSCLEPDCPCKGGVPLALITYDPQNPDAGFEIDTQGRRTLAVPRDYFTHIVGINWPHGGEVSLSHLRHHMKGRLEIRFDRKILPSPSGMMPNPTVPQPTGVSAYTFLAEYGGVQRDIRPLPFLREKPPGLDEDCLAVFTINPEYLEAGSEDNVGDNIIYVTLKCDFILDCHNNPVDGAHRGARLPSGDGRGGRHFESWFKVSRNHHEHHEHHEHRGEHEAYEKAGYDEPVGQPEPPSHEGGKKRRRS
jgi:hypothetical protein